MEQILKNIDRNIMIYCFLWKALCDLLMHYNWEWKTNKLISKESFSQNWTENTIQRFDLYRISPVVIVGVTGFP